jgi:hypothetical protein
MQYINRNDKKTLWQTHVNRQKPRIHNFISKATLCYGIDLWLMNRQEQKQLEAVQMCFLRPLGFATLDNQTIVNFREKLNQDNIVAEIRNCKQKWPQNVNRTEINRIPKLALR